MAVRRAVGSAGALALFLAAGCQATDVPVVSAPSAQASGPALSLAERAAATGVAQATYTFALRRAGGKPGTVVAAVALPRYRVGLAGDTAGLYATAAGTFRCASRGRAAHCARLAGPGAPVPVGEDPLPARLFTLDLDVLGVRPGDFRITRALPVPARSPVPAAACWQVQPASRAPAGVDAGRYCLSATGLPVAFDLGKTSLRLTAVGPAPTRASLRLPR